MDEQLIKTLKNDSAFGEFASYISAKIEELDTATGFDDMNDQEAGQEVKARSKAIRILHKIFQPFIDFRDKKEPSEKEINEAKKSYGL
jgi:hypothetical protein